MIIFTVLPLLYILCVPQSFFLPYSFPISFPHFCHCSAKSLDQPFQKVTWLHWGGPCGSVQSGGWVVCSSVSFSGKLLESLRWAWVLITLKKNWFLLIKMPLSQRMLFFPLQGFLVRIKMALKWHRSPVNNMRNLRSNSYMKIDYSF